MQRKFLKNTWSWTGCSDTGDRVLAGFYQYAEHYHVVNTDNESRRVKQQARDTTRIAGFAAQQILLKLKPEEVGAAR